MVEYAPAVYGYDYGPMPPWFDAARILEADPVLIWKSRPGVQRTYLDVFSPAWRDEDRIALLRRFRPSLPPAWRSNRVYDMSLNSDGFRDIEFPRTKSPSTFRILCLGDSWTFGASVGQDQTYPRRLQARLRREFPTGNFEVLNLGVLGYSSLQGLQLLKQRGLGLEPDFIVVGFATNDMAVVGWRDKDLVDAATSHPDRKAVPAAVRRRLLENVEQRLGGWVEHVESYKLLRYLALVVTSRPRTVGTVFAELARPPEPPAPGRGDQREADPRVSLPDYETNIRDMIDLARRRDAGSMLLFNEFGQYDDYPYRIALERIARRDAVPYLDSTALFAAARKRMEDEIEKRLDLRPVAPPRVATGDMADVVFRVSLGTRPVAKAMYVVGNHPALGHGVPNRVAMYDDGTHGDQRAGDAVWSYSARLPRRTSFAYVYTNSGEPGRWEGLDVPEIRSLTVRAAGAAESAYLPIDSFGRIYMKGDSWHTDASGYDLMAGAIVEALKRDARFRRYLERRAGGRP